MNAFVDVLEKLGITVKRPETWPHEAKFSTIHWDSEGYYNLCPRDILLVIGDHIIETPNVIRSRAQETFSYRAMMVDYLKSGAKWCNAPKPMLLDSLFEVDPDKPTPRNGEPAFDAANVLRLGQDLIYLVSGTGNEMGGKWLQTILGDAYRVHFLKDVYYGSNYFNNRLRGLLCSDVCGVEAVPLGGGEGAARADGHLPIQLNGCLWRLPPRERTASGRNTVAHRGLQPLR